MSVEDIKSFASLLANCADPQVSLFRACAEGGKDFDKVMDALPKEVLTAHKWRRGGRWSNPSVVVRFSAYFYEDKHVTRRFSLKMGKHVNTSKDKKQNQLPEFLLAVDGRVITDKSKRKKLTGELNLRPGVYRLEIWATGWVENVGFGRTVKLQANLDDFANPGESEDSDRAISMVDCPDSFFDPATFPKGILDNRNSQAEITANRTATEFKVKFAPGSRTRLLKLQFVEQEGPVPVLNKLLLTWQWHRG